MHHLQFMCQFLPHSGLRQTRPKRHRQDKEDDTPGDHRAQPSLLWLVGSLLLQQLLYGFGRIDVRKNIHRHVLTDLVINIHLAYAIHRREVPFGTRRFSIASMPEGVLPVCFLPLLVLFEMYWPLRSPFSGCTRACPYVVRKEYWRALVRS